VSLVAITREVSAGIGRCELTHLERRPIDVKIARSQHKQYELLLRSLGCSVHTLPALDDYPDSVFVEDPALVLDELAVLLRPGAASRRGESASLESALGPFRTVKRIEAPGCIDGGDVIQIGKTIFVGESSRSNAAAVAQLREIVLPLGYEVKTVPVKGVLHLKSAATAISENRLLINPQMVPETALEGFEILHVDPAEPFAANALRVGSTVVTQDAFPRTRALLEQAGLSVRSVDASELAKAEGALTCCSLLFR
jgi:dimethylargininase